MKSICNLHTHCTFCHGKATMEEMTKAAIDAGYRYLGFSSHNPTGFDFDRIQVKQQDIQPYFDEIDRLNAVYGDRIRIFKAFEVESRNAWGTKPVMFEQTDYNIGSVHWLEIDGQYHAIDSSVEKFENLVKAAESVERVWKQYFEEVSSYAEGSDYEIAGHLDLISKFNQVTGMFDENDRLYRNLALECVERVVRAGKIVEVNLGAMNNGYRSQPYPSRFMLERAKELGAKVIISTDAHVTGKIAMNVEWAEDYLRSLGFSSVVQLDESGWTEREL